MITTFPTTRSRWSLGHFLLTNWMRYACSLLPTPYSTITRSPHLTSTFSSRVGEGLAMKFLNFQLYAFYSKIYIKLIDKISHFDKIEV